MALAIGLLVVLGLHAAYGEAGEPFVVNEAPRVPPPVVPEEKPAAAIVPAPHDPPGMEAARGARIHDVLAKLPARHASMSTSLWKPLPTLPAPPAKFVAAPAKPSLLVPPAVAAESAVAAAPPAGWRQLIASSYAVWVAAIVLIGFPLASWLWRQLRRRSERDLEGDD